MLLKKCLMIFIISMSLLINLFAQDIKREREVIVKTEINQLLQSQYSGLYIVADIVDIDSLTGDLRYFYANIQNPYGMLTNSFVFLTNTSSELPYTDPIKNKLGIFKDNTISWISESELPDDYGKIFAIDDITNDGRVEILTKWGYPLSTIWIHSWDGATASRVNAAEDGYSKIEGNDRSFELFDCDGDGSKEIWNIEDENTRCAWNWNGIEYDYMDNASTIPSTELFPANNFIPVVSVNIEKEDETYTYDYTVSSDAQSKQRIDMFHIVADVSEESIYLESPKHWIEMGSKGKRKGWSTEVLNNGNLIWPGSTLGGFIFETTGLPAIVEFSMQAENRLPDLSDMEKIEAIQILFKNYTENIVKGKTIGPIEPHDTLDNIRFLDSLISYDSTAYQFGWIIDQKTFDKIDKYLGKAKEELEKSKVDKSKSALKKVLKEVEKEKSTSLSSEAYALLKYNTEYLIEHLPPFGMILDSISPTMTITKTKIKDFKLKVYGINFTKKCDVYFNGKKKKTKFISGNELEAEIKDKDFKKEGSYIVTVREKKAGQTEGAEFNVYKELPQPLIPVLNCVEDLEGKKSIAWFGYENYNDGIVYIEGKDNKIKGGKKKKGSIGGKGKDKYEDIPPVIFLPGVHEKVFSVEFDDKKKVKWELLKEKAEVTDETPLCQ